MDSTPLEEVSAFLLLPPLPLVLVVVVAVASGTTA
jgi:hypothetical protein